MANYQSFSDISKRLDDIVKEVRNKDVSLEKSLDLFDEAIKLGSRAVDMVDATDFTPEEALALDEKNADAANSQETAESTSDTVQDSAQDA